jgi:Ca-activated chloride channel family protein
LIPPDIAKKLAITYGIKVYCIGIGSEVEMDVQVNTALGTVMEKRKMTFDENLLKQISAETGGQYFQASNKAALKTIYESINQLEKSKIEITTYDRYTDEYLPLLLAGLAIVILELVIRLTVLRKFP